MKVRITNGHIVIEVEDKYASNIVTILNETEDLWKQKLNERGKNNGKTKD